MMIKNQELVFNEEDHLTDDTEETSAEDLNLNSSSFIDQLVISMLCLVLLMVISRSSIPWLKWTRERIHLAMNATCDATFGRVFNSAAFQNLLVSGQNLVQLDEITGKFAGAHWSSRGSATFQNSIWPVQGSITRGFGWRNKPGGYIQEFRPGIEIAAPQGADVLAVAAGEISRVHYQTGTGWQITINHGNGWDSTYNQLYQPRVKSGQSVKAGDIIGQTGGINPNQKSIVKLEIRKDQQPIDPLSVIVN